MSILTLTTDFGLHDGFVGMMKGVIWGICPEAQIADITHAVSPQDVLEGAFVMRRACPFFPPGTVHIGVVDPGVGTERRPLAIRLGAWFFVGPDNGLFTSLLEWGEAQNWPVEVVHTTNEKYWLPGISRTFHGRDIFAPVGAHLARGVQLSELGPALTDPIRIHLPKPEKTRRGWLAHVIAVDHFGNLATDLPASAIRDRAAVRLNLGGHTIRGLVDSYGRQAPGELVALEDSSGRLEIAVVNGSAARVTAAGVGDDVEVIE
jgi:S-adenosylmethionine hydrolase